MVEIMKASELAKVSEDGKVQFEKEVLEGSEFKSLIEGIENAALKGYTGWWKKLDSKSDIRMYQVFMKALNTAGYKAEIKNEFKTGGLVSYYQREFHVSWKEESE